MPRVQEQSGTIEDSGKCKVGLEVTRINKKEIKWTAKVNFLEWLSGTGDRCELISPAFTISKLIKETGYQTRSFGYDVHLNLVILKNGDDDGGSIDKFFHPSGLPRQLRKSGCGITGRIMPYCSHGTFSDRVKWTPTLYTYFYLQKADGSLHSLSTGISINLIKQLPCEYLSQGNLIIVLRIATIDGPPSHPPTLPPSSPYVVGVEDADDKEKGLSYHLGKCPVDFTRSNDPMEYSDFTIYVKKDEAKLSVQLFHCHRLLLAAKSSVFRAMFDGGFIECKSNMLTITDFDPTTIGNMLNFIYNNALEEASITAELLYAADKYEIPLLIKECEKVFLSQLSTENAAGIWLTLHIVGSESAKSRVMQYIADFWPDIQETECCKNITRGDPKLPLQLLSYLYGNRKTLQYADVLQEDMMFTVPL